MENIIELLKSLNIGQLVVIGGMFWFFYHRLDGKIEKLETRLSADILGTNVRIDGVHTRIDKLDEKLSQVEERLNQRIDDVEEKLSQRIDKLGEKVEDVDRRLCRIEGSLATHGHCLFNQTYKEKEAE